MVLDGFPEFSSYSFERLACTCACTSCTPSNCSQTPIRHSWHPLPMITYPNIPNHGVLPNRCLPLLSVIMMVVGWGCGYAQLVLGHDTSEAPKVQPCHRPGKVTGHAVPMVDDLWSSSQGFGSSLHVSDLVENTTPFSQFCDFVQISSSCNLQLAKLSGVCAT